MVFGIFKVYFVRANILLFPYFKSKDLDKKFSVDPDSYNYLQLVVFVQKYFFTSWCEDGLNHLNLYRKMNLFHTCFEKLKKMLSNFVNQSKIPLDLLKYSILSAFLRKSVGLLLVEYFIMLQTIDVILKKAFYEIHFFSFI